MTIDPQCSPTYAKSAMIQKTDVIKGLPLSVGEIAAVSKVHPNTVSSKMNGQTGIYAKVHAVFTAVSISSGNAFSRSEYVLYKDGDTNQFFEDATLDSCRVFPNLPQIMRDLGVDAKSIAKQANVKTHLVKNIAVGLPVARNIVDAVFEAVAAQTPLDRADEVFF